jgi:hypothetical protein
VKPEPEIDERYRSLLQKAVRRGHVDLVVTVGAYLESAAGPKWFDRRTELIVLGECWPLMAVTVATRASHGRLAPLLRAAQARKNRDAVGLGFLAYALARGDRSVLEATEREAIEAERPLKLLAHAVQRPGRFWEWVEAQPCSEGSRRVIVRCRGRSSGDRPHDQAVAQAAAYLALSAPLPETPTAPPAPGMFPYWTVFDRHTTAGRRALRDIARDLHIPPRQLEWCFYYFEGSLANADAPAPWWLRYRRWSFDRHGLRPEEATLLWEPARRQLSEALSDDSRTLQGDLYAWMLGHRERVDALRRQLELFLDRLDEVPRNQPELF